MAVSVWKDVLYPGRQRDRWGQWFTLTTRDTAAAARNLRKMVRRGLRVPVCWEHQEEAEPVELSRGDRLANYAKHTFGEIRDARVDQKGVLWLKHEIYDPEDAKRLKKTKYCSPKVYPGYSDSRGGEYRGATIGHVGVTPTPVQWWQKPYELSRKGAFYLSYSAGGDPVAEENDIKGGGEGGGEGGGGPGESLTALIEALRGAGLTIPDEVTDIAGLIIAVKASGGSGGDSLDDELDDAAGLGAGAGTDTAAGGGPPMLMSDPRAVEKLSGMARRDLESRIKALFASGRIDRPTARSLLRDARAVQLSFTRDAELLPNKVVTRVEAFESLPKGLAWQKSGSRRVEDAALELSDTRAVARPGELTGTKDEDAVKEATEFLCANLPRKK